MEDIVPSEKLQAGRVVVYAGAVLAFFIGAGFATGQEVLMYFVSYGSQMFIVIGVSFVMVAWGTISFAAAGSKCAFQANAEVFQYYCGKYIGTFFDYFSVIFCFACYIFMCAGSGSSLQQQFGVPPIVGATAMGAAVILTVTLGLQKITEILGRLGMIIIVMVLFSATWNLLANLDMVGPNMRAIDSGGWEQFGMEKSIAPSAFLAGGSYIGSAIIWLITFVAMMASQSKYKREVKAGMAAGSLAIGVSLTVCALAMTAVVQQVGGADAPNLIMAGNIWNPLGSIYSILVVLGIYTSAVPLLWTPVARFTKESSGSSRVLTFTLGLLGLAIALFIPYRTLINYILSIGGAMVYVLWAFMAVKDVRSLFARRGISLKYESQNKAI